MIVNWLFDLYVRITPNRVRKKTNLSKLIILPTWMIKRSENQFICLRSTFLWPSRNSLEVELNKDLTFNKAIQHATSSAWAASSIITKSNVILSSLRDDAPVKVANTTSAFLRTSVTASCCLFRSSFASVLSSFLISLFAFLSLAFNNFPFNAWY